MAIGAHELRGRKHDAPDDEIDDHLLGPGDRVARRDIATDHLHEADDHRGKTEQADQEPLSLVPPSIAPR